jgi:CheY-like chemotaxis protein
VTLSEIPPSEALMTATLPPAEDKLRLDGMKVLVVDDGETNRRLLQLVLTRAGAVVESAENGGVALERVMHAEFDAILMDMQMPVLDGYSATRQLRAQGITTPIIALTAHAMSGEKQKCLSAGCDGYLTKPVDRHELLKVLHQSRSWPTPSGSSNASDEPAPAAPARDVLDDAERLTTDLDVDDPEIREIVGLYVDRLPSDLEQLQSAWESRNWTDLSQRVHSLKGSAAMTGFSRLSEAARELEDILESRDDRRTQQALEELQELGQRVQRPEEPAGHMAAV